METESGKAEQGRKQVIQPRKCEGAKISADHPHLARREHKPGSYENLANCHSLARQTASAIIASNPACGHAGLNGGEPSRLSSRLRSFAVVFVAITLAGCASNSSTNVYDGPKTAAPGHAHGLVVQGHCGGKCCGRRIIRFIQRYVNSEDVRGSVAHR